MTLKFLYGKNETCNKADNSPYTQRYKKKKLKLKLNSSYVFQMKDRVFPKDFCKMFSGFISIPR